jgi:NADH-quinone oxidoreductase subunit M
VRGMIGLIGTILPFLILFLASWGPVRGRRLWILSLFTSLFSWACYVYLVAGFYLNEIGEPGAVFSPVLLGQNPWTDGLGLRWDFQGSVLSLAAATVVLCFHFLARKTLEASRSSVAALASYLGCLLGALAAGHLLLFTVFFAGSLVPRFVFSGVEARGSGIHSVREAAFLGVVAVFCLLVVFLAFSGPFHHDLSRWFQLSTESYVVLPGSIGFSLMMVAAAIGAGLFPFHGNARKVFEPGSVERAVPLALQPLFGFTILFRFAVELFPQELRQFGPVFLGTFAVGLAYGAVNLLGSRSARDRAFWLQQASISLVAVGFFSLDQMGWHGASVLLLFQSLALPFFLIVLSCHERRGAFPVHRIADFPAFALSTVLAVLAVLFLPVSIGFYGLLLVTWSLLSLQNWFLPFVIVAIPVAALAGISSMFFQLGRGREASERTDSFRELDREEVMAILPIGAILLILGLAPKVLMDPMGAAAAELLRAMGN